MSDLKQTVILLNQERIESKLKLELLEAKVDQLVGKFDHVAAASTFQGRQDKLDYAQLSEKYEKVEQEMKALEQQFNSMSIKVSSPINKAKSFELLSSKVSKIDSRANLLKTKMAFIEQRLPSIQGGAQANISHVQTRLTALEASYKSITPLKEQGVIKFLLEQAVQTENTLDIHSNDIKQLSSNLAATVNKSKKEQENQHASGEKLKKQVATLSESFKIANFAIGKLQTVTQEQYRTLLPIAKKVDTHEENLIELSTIVNDIADYHLELAQSKEAMADPTLEVEQETEAQKESHDMTSLAKPMHHEDQHDEIE